jgi:glycosyltransferase involved in cell wall biosynthesis
VANILHIVPSLDQAHGGPLRLVLDLSAKALPLGLESEVAGPGPLNAADNPLPPSRIHAFPVDRSPSWAHCSSLSPWLRTNLPRFQGVVIHGAWLFPGWAASVECRRAGIPYAYYPHGMLERWAVTGQGRTKELKKRLYWTLRERAIAASAAAILFTTHKERDLTRQTFRIPVPDRILAPYGFAPEATPAPAPANPALLQPPGSRVALFLGRLHPKKNPALLIEAWRRAAPPPHWRLLFAGSGDPAFEQHLASLVQQAGLQSSVLFTGFLSGSDKQYLLQRADWFLLPSSQENFGIAVLEAIENGAAVALSPGVYLTESFPPESEILPPNPDAWADFFRLRMPDDDWRIRIRDGNRRHLLQHFSMPHIVDNWVDTFASLFAFPPRSGS